MLFDVLKSINQIFEAGIAITALSLFLRALTFNLRDRVSRAFAIILACVMVIFSGEAVNGAVASPAAISFWMHFQWVGIIFLPPAYLHFSDALLATTGQPSRGRRRAVVRWSYLVSAGFLALLPFGLLVGPVVLEGQPLPHLERTWLSWLFTFYYLVVMLMAGYTIWRAYNRTVLSTSRRRMRYLSLGALSVAVGAYPYLLLGSGFAVVHPLIFLSVALIGNAFVFLALVAMAYATAFFGVAWPDRVVKSRLFKWLLRGPGTVFVVLAVITAIRQFDELLGTPYAVLIPVLTAVSILLMAHSITLGAPIWERWLFQGKDRDDLRLLQNLEERLITTGDLRQFLEAVLAAVCDQFQVSTAFVAALGATGLETVVQVGDKDALPGNGFNLELLHRVGDSSGHGELFSWGDFWLVPLYSTQDDGMLGLMGVWQNTELELAEEQFEALEVLGQRAALILEDRQMQRQVFQALESLNPRVDLIQRLRAASQYDQREVLSDLDALPEPSDISTWVKEALSHYWGGPKLTKSPLLRFQVVQQALKQHEGNPANAMRAILQQAVEQIRPEGERRFTGEWLLYNILELKFMQGRKVRDVAMRLAMSEADLYRKQRVAIGAVANAIIDMERTAWEDLSQEEELVNHEVQRAHNE